MTTTATKEIPRQQWKDYFDRLTKQHLRDDRFEAATIELLSPDLGDQVELEAIHLQGISFDPKSDALEVLLENVDRLVYRPKGIWVVEGQDGFPRTIEILREDGTKEIMTLSRKGPLTPRE